MLSAVRHLIVAATVLLVVGAFPVSSSPVHACPNCKNANESYPNRPTAYMYSILFMIGMPATIFTGFSLGFYRMVRNAQKQAEPAELTPES